MEFFEVLHLSNKGRSVTVDADIASNRN